MNAPELAVERYDGITGDQRILLLRGPLIVTTIAQFERAIRYEDAANVILDLSDVPYIDSVGLGSLIARYVAHQKSGRCIVLAGVTAKVKHVLAITQLDKLLMTFPTTWEAAEALANTGAA
jgi:anti-anti-sigma factor